MKQITFRKTYTRDTTLIMQQLWFGAQTKGLENQLGITPKYSITGVDYLHQGVIEVWENTEAIHWIKQQLVRLSHRQPEKILSILARYERELRTLYPIWRTDRIKSKKKLLTFIQKIEVMTVGDLVLCYLSGQPSTDKRIYSIAKRLRAADHFFASNDRVLRRSLASLYPSLSKYITCIMREEVLNKISLARECKRRFQHFILTSHGYHAVETLASYEQKNRGYVFSGVREDLHVEKDSIRGLIVQSGVARGPVRILQRIAEMQSVRKGDIIVSPMTTPVFLPGLKKAAAIVTDEGGLLCHAAIVARELQIPCIVGTEYATGVLKDGDMVEVDAEHGIVKKM